MNQGYRLHHTLYFDNKNMNTVLDVCILHMFKSTIIFFINKKFHDVFTVLSVIVLNCQCNYEETGEKIILC